MALICAPLRAHHGGMKRERIPPSWRHLHPGDQIGSRLPLHRIQRHLQQLEAEGFRFHTRPSPAGYWLVCEERPEGERNAYPPGSAGAVDAAGVVSCMARYRNRKGKRPGDK